jgi:hypothetical protein
MLKEFNRRGKARIPENPDVLYEDETDRLVAMTLGWRNVADGGKEIAFSADAARALYENRELDIREQVQAGLGRRELFTKSSATI